MVAREGVEPPTTSTTRSPRLANNKKGTNFALISRLGLVAFKKLWLFPGIHHCTLANLRGFSLLFNSTLTVFIS
jgi:hypothetical protein